MTKETIYFGEIYTWNDIALSFKMYSTLHFFFFGKCYTCNVNYRIICRKVWIHKCCYRWNEMMFWDTLKQTFLNSIIISTKLKAFFLGKKIIYMYIHNAWNIITYSQKPLVDSCVCLLEMNWNLLLSCTSVRFIFGPKIPSFKLKITTLFDFVYMLTIISSRAHFFFPLQHPATHTVFSPLYTLIPLN